jgi:predicted transcriptional regulator
MPDAPETTPDAAVTDAPSAEVDGETGPLTVSDTLDQLREKGIESFMPEEGDDEGDSTDGADDDGVPGGDVPDGDAGDEDGAEGGDASEDDAVADAAAGESDDPDSVAEGGGDDEAGDDTDASLTVEIPGRREGETVSIEVNDPELAERLQQLANDGMRRREFNVQAEALRTKGAEIKTFQDRLATDPSGLILEKATPQTREVIVRDILLSDPALLSRMLDQLNDIETDPNARQAAVATMERDAAVRAREVDRLTAENESYLASANEIIGAVEALIPEDAPDDKVNAFLEDALAFLEFKATKEGPSVVNPANIKNLVGSRLQLHGIVPSTAPADPDGSGDGAATPATPKVVLKKATPAQVEQAAQEGEKLTTRSKQRKAAVTAPAGAGADTAQFTPPKGQGIKERIAWMRKTHPNF